MARWATPLDAMFLMGEGDRVGMHVGSLMPFTPPADAGPTYAQDMLAEALAAPVVSPWNLKLALPGLLKSPVNRWVEDPDFDITYHVRSSALPRPGGERELGVLVSRLHSNRLDFRRPPWEMHIIEGLEGGRHAIYIKIHHALIDGFTGMKILGRSLSVAPDDRTHPFFFSVPTGGPRASGRGSGGSGRRSAVSTLRRNAGAVAEGASWLAGTAGGLFGVGRAWLDTQVGGPSHPTLVSSHEAPASILGSAVSQNRRFATQTHSLDRYAAVARAAGGTLNDVLVAVCGGALRRFLLDLDALPTDPLVAFLPVNVRAKDSEGGGNMVGATLVSLGTHIADAADRMDHVVSSTTAAKERMEGMTREQIVAYSGLLLAPAGLQFAKAAYGVPIPVPVTFNLCISNVPGPQQTLFQRGSRLEATYPLSIVGHSMALNITAHSYDGHIDIGFLGCRDTLPRLQNIAVYAGDALADLEAAFGVGGVERG